jgi:hypothetical protein
MTPRGRFGPFVLVVYAAGTPLPTDAVWGFLQANRSRTENRSRLARNHEYIP